MIESYHSRAGSQGWEGAETGGGYAELLRHHEFSFEF